MAVGQNELMSHFSYLAIGREAVFKTYNTCSSILPFQSANLKTTQENKILEQVERSRTYSKRISMMKKIEGEIEGYVFLKNTAFMYLLQNAFGGTITSATATGDTAGGLAFEHTLEVGDFKQATSSLCMNVRKGDSAAALIFQYSGVRVNEFALVAEMEEALRYTASIMAVNSTVGGTDLATVLGDEDCDPISFVNGRLSIETSQAAITTTSFWHVQSINLGVNNSLKADAASGRIGSNVLDVLPAGIASFPFTVTMRFDTLTAYNAMLNETKLAGQFEFLGATMPGSTLRSSILLDMPALYISDAGDPQVSGPDEILTAELTLHVLRDCATSTGYAMRAKVRNLTASY